jgi:acyl transferase domain-containing protein
MARIGIVCPGRGSYTEKTLRSLPASHPWVAAADRLREARGLEPLSALDAAARFERARHLRPANASPLIWLVTMIDAAGVMEHERCVACAGNSMGWYTALAVAGALSFEDSFRLVQEMSLLQEEGEPGGQVLYPLVDDDWRRSEERLRSVEGALASAPGQAFWSIRLGGYAVLAGSEEGMAHLLRALPRCQLGTTPYPFRLQQHGPYHTPLARGVSERARARLADLDFRAPRTTLVDGRGVRFTPHASDLAALADYTLGAQVTTPYDLSLSLCVLLREEAPERLVLPGPGNTLGGVCAQVLIAERWSGIGSRADFESVQASTAPFVISLRR